jgi:hypothetical protein
MDISPGVIVCVCDLFNEEQKQLTDYMAHDKLMNALYPLPGEYIVLVKPVRKPILTYMCNCSLACHSIFNYSIIQNF